MKVIHMKDTVNLFRSESHFVRFERHDMLRHDTHPAQCNQLPIMPHNVSMLFVFVNVGGKIDKCQSGG